MLRRRAGYEDLGNQTSVPFPQHKRLAWRGSWRRTTLCGRGEACMQTVLTLQPRHSQLKCSNFAIRKPKRCFRRARDSGMWHVNAGGEIAGVWLLGGEGGTRKISVSYTCQKFLTWLSVRPGRRLAISDQRFPISALVLVMIASSSADHAPFLIAGSPE